ncbi:MAG: hypothetical protein JSS30_08600 [Verrucomicrobia bacterium]|nr:hypothetical protein [Verrucomicrobiota bacterium]
MRLIIDSTNYIDLGLYRSFELSKPLLSQQAKNKISTVFWTTIACWSVYNLVDYGLASLLVLETLQHGTGPFGFIGINLFGADPNFGGGKRGSSVGMGYNHHINNSKNFFHLFKDSEFPTEDFFNKEVISAEVQCSILKKILPRQHAIFSGMATCGYSHILDPIPSIEAIIGAALGYLTPTLKFRFAPEDLLCKEASCRFINDDDYSGFAYKTAQPIPSYHLGITGSLTQGINSNLWDRMKANPYKVAVGLAFLTTAAIVAKMTYTHLTTPTKKEEAPAAASPASCCQNLKGKVKSCIKYSFWTGLAIALITLNTL